MALLLISALAGCGADEKPTVDRAEASGISEPETDDNHTTPTPPSADEKANIDVDLTKLSSTMVYAEVCHMMSAPGDYTGKTVKMRGAFSVYHDQETGMDYFACIIEDATACCAQGLEFVPTGEYVYPDDYPAIGADITVTGTFGTYEENGYWYCRLTGAALV